MNIPKKVVYIIAGVTGGLAIGLTTMVITLVATGDKDYLNEKTLDVVENVSYNPGTSVLSWDKVSFATDYKVSINGFETTVKENSYKFLPNQKNLTFAVQAIDSSNTYKNNEWSTPVRYTFNNTDVSFARMNIFAKDLVHEEYKFEKLLMMDLDENYLNALILTSQDNIQYVSEYQVNYGLKIESFSDLLKEKAPGSSLKNVYPLANYDGANALLESGNYDGMFADIHNFINEGYHLEIVSQSSVKKDNNSAIIYTILKAKKNVDIKYIRNDVLVTYNDKVLQEEDMFDKFLKDPSKRNISTLKGEVLSFSEYELAASIDHFNN